MARLVQPLSAATGYLSRIGESSNAALDGRSM